MTDSASPTRSAATAMQVTPTSRLVLLFNPNCQSSSEIAATTCKAGSMESVGSNAIELKSEGNSKLQGKEWLREGSGMWLSFLPHPCCFTTSTEVAIGRWGQSGRQQGGRLEVFEIQRGCMRRGTSSAFIGQHVIKDASPYILTPVDPLFYCLHILLPTISLPGLCTTSDCSTDTAVRCWRTLPDLLSSCCWSGGRVNNDECSAAGMEDGLFSSGGRNTTQMKNSRHVYANLCSLMNVGEVSQRIEKEIADVQRIAVRVGEEVLYSLSIEKLCQRFIEPKLHVMLESVMRERLYIGEYTRFHSGQRKEGGGCCKSELASNGVVANMWDKELQVDKGSAIQTQYRRICA
eukprot:GHVS01045117.1.p1 GENE.GHVS01045117.1~~GHVS01045117.1.p1  ORF type:complete len:348 (-),score=38.81 GHVS01045117.1:553-1596(-)